jgi:hypothetical protein
VNFRSTGVAACLLAAVTGAATAGCASATTSPPVSPPGGGTHPSTSAAPASAAAASASAAPSGCQRPAGDVLTLASNGKTYCVRVGERFDVYLRGTVASRWLEPLASSDILKGVPNGALSLAAGLTGASFAAVQPGQAAITSVRPPCPGPLGGKPPEAMPAFPLPKVYPLHSCAAARRFLVTIIVGR